MRRVIAVSLVGFATLGLGAQKASAWWLLDALFDNQRCCGPVCKQYNAFSPFCYEGVADYPPMPGYGYGGSQAWSFPDGQGYHGELPAPGTIAGPTANAPATPPANVGSFPPSSARNNNAQAIQPGVGPQPGLSWGTGMMNRAAVPGYYPGFTSYGTSGMAGPPPYPGFNAYGPANGFGR